MAIIISVTILESAYEVSVTINEPIIEIRYTICVDYVHSRIKQTALTLMITNWKNT